MIEPESFFSALSNNIRLRALLLLEARRELCVCDLTDAIGAAQPAMSRHLSHLRTAGIVQDRRDGLWIHYRLHPELPKWAMKVLRATAAGVAQHPPFADDRTLVDEMPKRPGASRCA